MVGITQAKMVTHHKKLAVPLTHQGDLGTKHGRQRQGPRHHSNRFLWDHANIPEDDHQNNQLEQDIHKVEKLGKGDSKP